MSLAHPKNRPSFQFGAMSSTRVSTAKSEAGPTATNIRSAHLSHSTLPSSLLWRRITVDNAQNCRRWTLNGAYSMVSMTPEYVLFLVYL